MSVAQQTNGTQQLSKSSGFDSSHKNVNITQHNVDSESVRPPLVYSHTSAPSDCPGSRLRNGGTLTRLRRPGGWGVLALMQTISPVDYCYRKPSPAARRIASRRTAADKH